MAELRGCAAPAGVMTDAQALRRQCLAAVDASGLHPVGDLFHGFADDDPATGVTGVVLLAESHLAVHTWPELGAVTLDVYVCNRGADNAERARALLARLETLFVPADAERHAVQRGRLAA